MRIEKASVDYLDEVESLYDSVNDHLANHTNYPGWRKGVYPTRVEAENGIASDSLYVVWVKDRIVGSIILNHEIEKGYDSAVCNIEAANSGIFVVHTLAVHPDFLRQGIGRYLLEFAIEQGKKDGMKALRLDVYEKNTPAIKLYEKLGFKYIATVDLGYGNYGLDWFKLYERCL